MTTTEHEEDNKIVEWRPWPRDTRYVVGSDGTIIGASGRVLKPGTHRGRKFISKREGGKHISPVVAVIVCETFHGPRPHPKMHCAHEDGNPANDHAYNLSWKTCSENQRDRDRHGTSSRGEKSSSARLTESQVLEIRAKRAAGMTTNALAAEYGTYSGNISKIVLRQRWTHI